MSIRSVTTVRSRWTREGAEYKDNANIYRHHDGYLEGHGAWLHKFMDGLHVVNGIGGDMPKRYANGPDRLAAQMVAQLQIDGHNPGLMSQLGDVGQEYHYMVSVDFGNDGGKISINVFDGPMTAFGEGGDECTREIFTGTVEEYGAFLSAPNVDSLDVKSE